MICQIIFFSFHGIAKVLNKFNQRNGLPQQFLFDSIHKNFVHLKIFVSSIVFAVFFILNIILWIMGSSGAIPFLTLVAVLSLWFGISVPLTFVGAYFGFKKPVWDLNYFI